MPSQDRFRRAALRTACWLAALVTVASGAPVPASAQAPEAAPAAPLALSVSPAIVDNTLDAGQSFTTQITVGNVSDAPLNVRASVESLQSGQRVDSDFAALNSASWFTGSQRDFSLGPREQRVLGFDVQAPANAEPGGHYATIYFQALNTPSQLQGTGATISARVGVVVLLTIRGEIVEKLVPVTPVRTDAVTTDKLNSFSFVVRNAGNVHQAPTAAVKVRDVRGHVVESIDVSTGVVLPHAEREFSVEWNSGNRIGLYRADATLVSGSTSTTLLVEQAWFALFPLWAAIPLAVLLGLMVLIWIIRKVRRRRRRKAAREKVRQAMAASVAPEDKPDD